MGPPSGNSKSPCCAPSRSLARHRPDLGLDSTRMDYKSGHEAVFYRRDHVLSYSMARLKQGRIAWLDQKDNERRASLASVAVIIT